MNKIFLVLLLAGCGPGPEQDQEQVPAGQLCMAEGVRFYHTDSVSCQRIESNARIARAVLAEHGLVADNFEPYFSVLKVEIKDEYNLRSYADFDLPEGVGVSGYYDRNLELIVLNKTGMSLVHELLHVVKRRQGHKSVPGEWHVGWDINGYNVASEEFKNKMIALDAP